MAIGDTPTGIIVGILGSSVAAATVTQYVTRRAESQAVARAEHEATCKLYEDTLIFLDQYRRKKGRGGEDLIEMSSRIVARLLLRSNDAIIKQFRLVGEKIQDWAELAQKANPLPGPEGMVIIQSGQGDRQAAADELYPGVICEIERMSHLMRTHLEVLRGANSWFPRFSGIWKR